VTINPTNSVKASKKILKLTGEGQMKDKSLKAMLERLRSFASDINLDWLELNLCNDGIRIGDHCSKIILHSHLLSHQETD